MQPAYDWVIPLDHPKCASEGKVAIMQISVKRTGLLIVNCFCIDCRDEFTIKRYVLELTAQAYANDCEIVGESPEPLYPALCTKPN